jgi:hypothetical protein
VEKLLQIQYPYDLSNLLNRHSIRLLQLMINKLRKKSDLHLFHPEIHGLAAGGTRYRLRGRELTMERILLTSPGSTTPPAATMRRRTEETSSHSCRKYLSRTTSFESCSSSTMAAGSAAASPSGAVLEGSDGAALSPRAAAASSIPGAGWPSTGRRGGCLRR